MSPNPPSTSSRVFLIALLAFLAIGAVGWLSFQPHQSMAQGKDRQMLAKRPSLGSSIMNQVHPYDLLDPVPAGQKAPDFSVTDATGQPVALSDFRGKKNVVMIFYQGSFCPVCGRQLENLQSRLKDFRDQDTEILAISSDDHPNALKTLGEHGLSFKVLPDNDLEIIKKYGVLNVSKNNIAWPAVFVVDKQGIVKLSHADRNYTRLYSDEILDTLSKITGKPLE